MEVNVGDLHLETGVLAPVGRDGPPSEYRLFDDSILTILDLVESDLVLQN